MPGTIGNSIGSRRRAETVFAWAATLVAAGCAEQGLDPLSPATEKTAEFPFEESLGPQTLLTSVTLADGNQVDFIEVDGSIVVSGTSFDAGEGLLSDAFAIDEAEPVSIYERLASAPAPAALVAAQRRVIAALDASESAAPGPPPSDLEPMPVEGVKVHPGDRPELTIWAPGVQDANRFRDQYCLREFTNLTWYVISCWTDLSTPVWSTYANSWGQLGVAHCKYGYKLWHGLLKWDSATGTWRSILPIDQISTGQSSWFYHFGATGYYRSFVFNVGYWESFHMTFKAL